MNAEHPINRAFANAIRVVPHPRSARKSKLYPPLLTPEELEKYKTLFAFAKSMVEGSYVGKHRSFHKGSSTEFNDYKEYAPGDDLKRLDWRVYGRNRRLFVRRYEAETEMVAYLLVDASASMRYCGANRLPKFFTASKIAASLAYLMSRQGDKTSLVTFSDHVQTYLPPGGTLRHLQQLISELEKATPSSTTGMMQSVDECAAIFKKRGRIVILSDFFTDTSNLFESFGQFLHRKFEIMLFHILDPDELVLPSIPVAKFQDMETQDELQVDCDEIRSIYRDSIHQFKIELERQSALRQVFYHSVNTANPYLDALEAFIHFREYQKNK